MILSLAQSAFASLILLLYGGWNLNSLNGGPQAQLPSVTVYPVTLAPVDFPDEFSRRVATVLATFLERGGLTQLDVATEPWRPAAQSTQKDLEKSFAEYIQSAALTTDFAVFVRIEGTPRTGADVIRTVVADRSGRIVFSEEAKKEVLSTIHPAPREPMTCCMFVAGRLQKLWNLDDPFRAGAPEGKLADFWKKDAGIPDTAELQKIRSRRQALSTMTDQVRFDVHILKAGEMEHGPDSAALAAHLTAKLKSDFRAAPAPAEVKTESHSNELKMLWTLAKDFRQHVRNHPPESAYTLCVEIGTDAKHVKYIHLVVCDQTGEWVLIDMINSHHGDFNALTTDTLAACFPLITQRLSAVVTRRD